MKNENLHKTPSMLINGFTRVMEFGNRWLTISGLFFKSDKNVFHKIELAMAITTLVCAWILMLIDKLTFLWGLVVSILLAQRVIEYFLVYSRNFLLNRGRIFSHFPSHVARGTWLILMFFLALLQVIFVFATWYRFISLHVPHAFTKTLTELDSVYFAMVTFLTVGYGDIAPVALAAKSIVVFQMALVFYTIIVVVNGLISIQFNSRK